MQQREEDLAVSVQCCYQRKSRVDPLEHRGGRTGTWSPQSSVVLSLVHPAFIDVDDPLAGLQQLDHPDCVLLTQHETAFRVGLYRHWARFPVAQPKLLPHDRAYLGPFGAQRVFLVNLLLNDRTAPYWPAVLQHLADLLSDAVDQLLLFLVLPSLLLYLRAASLVVLADLACNVLADVVLGSDVRHVH